MADDVSPPNPEHEHVPVRGTTETHEPAVSEPEPVVAVEVAPDTPAVVEQPMEMPQPVAEMPQEAAATVWVAEPPPSPQPEPAPPQEPELPAAKEKETASRKAVEATDVEVEAEEPAPEPELVPENKKNWFVVKVQSGREDTIKEAIEKRVRKEGLEEFFGQIVIPVEKITEIKQDKNGRRVTRTKERKLYPGYLMVEVEYNDRILYLFRETSGVGDFVGAHPNNLERPPTPMSDKEIQRMLGPKGKAEEPAVPVPPKNMLVGDRVRVVDGTFNGMEGTVKQILDAVGKVQVEVSIFGRPVAVELEYYQVEDA